DAGGDNDYVYAGTENDYVNGGDGIDTLFGEAGNDTIYGGAGDDYMVAGGGIDTLYGEGGSDRFVFAQQSGTDTIGDFQDGLDRIDLSTYGGATFANTTIQQSGSNTIITMVGGETITLVGISAATVTAADFIF
ncbi:MAG: hypothetical protein SGJ23_14870, partial [Alphaproteobacteria bacterium]|nr:hypothetical protein [Alphaproteobacteria bacterium]